MVPLRTQRGRKGYKMKILFLRIVLLGSMLALPQSTMAQVTVNIGISLPPPIPFAAPPRLVVLPETYVYAVPDVAVDIFFFDGWWWRPWEGRWYRSREYNRGWQHYGYVPSFYHKIPRGWRRDYREHHWHGHQWYAKPVHHRDVQRYWQNWEKERYWEKHQNWGVHDGRDQSYSRYQQKAAPQTLYKDRKKFKDRDDYEGHGHHGNH